MKIRRSGKCGKFLPFQVICTRKCCSLMSWRRLPTIDSLGAFEAASRRFTPTLASVVVRTKLIKKLLRFFGGKFSLLRASHVSLWIFYCEAQNLTIASRLLQIDEKFQRWSRFDALFCSSSPNKGRSSGINLNSPLSAVPKVLKFRFSWPKMSTRQIWFIYYEDDEDPPSRLPAKRLLNTNELHIIKSKWQSN